MKKPVYGYPTGLHAHGKRLWREVHAIRPSMGPGEEVLLAEACRLVDRLERLNGLIAGTMVPYIESEDGQTITLVIDAPQVEARLSAGALLAIIARLGLDRMVVPKTPRVGTDAGDKPAPPAVKGGGDPIDRIAAAREARAARRRETGA